MYQQILKYKLLFIFIIQLIISFFYLDSVIDRLQLYSKFGNWHFYQQDVVNSTALLIAFWSIYKLKQNIRLWYCWLILVLVILYESFLTFLMHSFSNM